MATYNNEQGEYNLMLKHLNRSPYFREVDKIMREIGCLDLWLAGGFLRNLIWDSIYGIKIDPEFNDLDMIYLGEMEDENREKEVENMLYTYSTKYKWSVKNQRKMAEKHGHQPYANISEALEHWVETATAIAYNPLATESHVLAPFGVQDLTFGVIRPTHKKFVSLAKKRAHDKGWLKRWPNLIFAEPLFS